MPFCPTCNHADKSGAFLHCRRFPPERTVSGGKWPTVTAKDWCGEHSDLQEMRLLKAENAAIRNSKKR